MNSELLRVLLELARTCERAVAARRRNERDAAAVLSLGERLQDVQRRALELERRFDDELKKCVPLAKTNSAEIALLQNKIDGMRDEMRDRIQALLDEQRVSIRQLALQSNEEAEAIAQAGRAVEVQFGEIARQIEELQRRST